MKNYFSYLNFRRSTVGKVLTSSTQSPRTGVNLSKNGIIFFNFDDWYQLASKGVVSSPYAFHWREIALTFPNELAVKHLSSFMDALNLPMLSDQAKAILFSIPSEKLPNHRVLENLASSTAEQERVKRLLIRKKIFGNEKFVREVLNDVITQEEDDEVRFKIEGGKEFVVKSDILNSPKLRREFTIFGMATIISISEKFLEEGGIIHHYYFLIDGDEHVCRMRENEYLKIILNSKHKKSETCKTELVGR